MNRHHRPIDRARIDPADRSVTSGGGQPVLLPGVVGLTVLGSTSSLPPPVRDLARITTDGHSAFAVAALAVAVLCLALPLGVRQLLAYQGSGRRTAASGRRRAEIQTPAEPPTCPWPGHDPGDLMPGGAGGLGTGAGSRQGGVEVDRAEAEEFLRLFHDEHPEAGPVEPRVAAVMREIDATGTYWHTPEELAFGARAAWRNNARCIGRLYWRSLQVRDLRIVSDAAGVARHCFEHLATANKDGRIRPTITVFAPETPDRPAPRIWNEQLIRYAGYQEPDGRVVGDPRYTAFTRAMIHRGWRPPERRGAFDVLPLVVETRDEGPRMFQLPREVVHEVELEHPELAWFSGLGLRWHSVPVISNNTLVIGGVSYPAAPFNGWYMGTEIGARNLGDTGRYDLVPVVAQRMGLDTSHEASLWRDRALVELNRAVLHSFRTRGVSITDHHTEAERFMTHVQREERSGRPCPADWTWIVPPMSGSQTPVFHRYYDSDDLRPSFVCDDETVRRGLEGRPAAFG